jgi:hypothetical protein
VVDLAAVGSARHLGSSTAWPDRDELDWTFLARNLARKLASISDVEAVERIVDDAERDALTLDAPAEFWRQVADESGRRKNILDHEARTRSAISTDANPIAHVPGRFLWASSTMKRRIAVALGDSGSPPTDAPLHQHSKQDASAYELSRDDPDCMVQGRVRIARQRDFTKTLLPEAAPARIELRVPLVAT